jgi:glycosyltransferase involved in cell wall biosynthesis
MNPLRILILSPDANPESISTALVGYAHAEALARHHHVTLVVRQDNVDAIRRAAAPFKEVVGIRIQGLDEMFAWTLKRIFRNNYGSHALTAFGYPFAVAFEWCAWRHLRRQITGGHFDVVLRLLPVTSVLPSPFAFFLRRGPIPFVIGPVNGGLPWPQGFVQTARQREWITGLRNAYRFLPFARSTYRDARAIIAGSSHTCTEFDQYRHKLFFVPENGLTHSQLGADRVVPEKAPLRLVYVGRLVPYKACDLAIRGALTMLRSGRASFAVIGDGPDRPTLEALARSEGVTDRVAFRGWLSHADTMEHLRLADVLVFPSLREFGGGVVFEALAAGVVPIVVAFGGPGDIVNPAVGYTVALTTPDGIVAGIQRALEELDANRVLLRQLSEAGMRCAREQLTWDRKAQAVSGILTWAAGRGPKPDLPPPSAQRAHAVA